MQMFRKTKFSSSNLPDAKKFGLLARRRRLRLHFQGVDVGDGDDGGGHVPREAHERADHHEDGHPEQVQVVACPFLGGGGVRHVGSRRMSVFQGFICNQEEGF